MDYTLTLPPAQAQVVWDALMQLPGRVAYATMKNVEAQYMACEAAESAPKTFSNPPEPAVAKPGE